MTAISCKDEVQTWIYVQLTQIKQKNVQRDTSCSWWVSKWWGWWRGPVDVGLLFTAAGDAELSQWDRERLYACRIEQSWWYGTDSSSRDRKRLWEWVADFIPRLRIFQMREADISRYHRSRHWCRERKSSIKPRHKWSMPLVELLFELYLKPGYSVYPF